MKLISIRNAYLIKEQTDTKLKETKLGVMVLNAVFGKEITDEQKELTIDSLVTTLSDHYGHNATMKLEVDIDLELIIGLI